MDQRLWLRHSQMLANERDLAGQVVKFLQLRCAGRGRGVGEDRVTRLDDFFEFIEKS